jgi:hypothetical protein
MRDTTPPNPEQKAPEPAGNFRSSEGRLHSSMGHLLIALGLMLVTSPFIEPLHGGNLIESVLITLVFLSAVLAVGGRRGALVWAIVLVIPALAGKWVNHWKTDLIPPEALLGAGLLFIIFVVAHLLGFILRAPQVNSEILCAGAATYLMLGWMWAFAYTLVARLVPESFAFTVGPASLRSMEGFRSLYFSYATLTTVSYGDIIPVGGGARMLAMLESVAGLFYVTLLIARLVALYNSRGRSDTMKDEG